MILTPETVDELPYALPLSLKMSEKEMMRKISATSVNDMDDDEIPFIANIQNTRIRSKRDVPEDLDMPSVSPHWLPGHVVGKSPQIIDFAVNYQQNRHQV